MTKLHASRSVETLLRKVQPHYTADERMIVNAIRTFVLLFVVREVFVTAQTNNRCTKTNQYKPCMSGKGTIMHRRSRSGCVERCMLKIPRRFLSRWNCGTCSNYPCFENTDELKKAVTSYIEGDKTVRSKYGSLIGIWCVDNITDFSELFQDKALFNEDISAWNVAKATSIVRMFSGASAFNQDLSQWDVSKVTSTVGLFQFASSFNKTISNWNVAAVTETYEMFRRAISFNQDLSNWKVSAVTDMYYMFTGAESFNQDISKWDVSKVRNMDSMFWGALEFNQDISKWDVSLVITTESMFLDASLFQQNLCPWGIRLPWNKARVFGMFQNSACPKQDDPVLQQAKPGPFCYPCS